jgi:hypothetical protein
MRNPTSAGLGRRIDLLCETHGIEWVHSKFEAFDVSPCHFCFIYNGAVVTAYCPEDEWFCKY